MIVAICGPDCAGKSTLWKALQGQIPAVFFSYPPVESLDRISELEVRDLWFWQHLYDPLKLYICDRFTVVSSAAYGKMYKRGHVDAGPWLQELRVVYLRPSPSLMRERLLVRGDKIQKLDRCEDAIVSYDAVIGCFTHATIAANVPLQQQVDITVTLVKEWIHASA